MAVVLTQEQIQALVEQLNAQICGKGYSVHTVQQVVNMLLDSVQKKILGAEF